MKEGDFVTLDYIGRIKESGELFDTTKEDVAIEEDAHNPNANYEPITIIIGGEMVIEGLDDKLKEMEVGEENKFTIKPEKAFGERKGDLIKTFSEKKFKNQDMNPYPGMRVNLDGRMARVLSVNSGRVRVDMNHPLAGRTIEYEVDVKGKVEETEDKVRETGKYFFGEETEVKLNEEENSVTVHVDEEVHDHALEDFEEKIKKYTEIEEVNFETKENEEENDE